MNYSLFISDLHLCSSRPHITHTFFNFLTDVAVKAHDLYILGDLFEYWAGDDEVDDEHHQTVCDALKQLSDSGVMVYFMHGNRDFLISERFSQASSAQLISDPTLIDLHGKRILLMHGDTLCTDDAPYLAFRDWVRDPQWQRDFLTLPLAKRKTEIENLRARSEQAKQYKSEVIMDVNEDAVSEIFRTYHYPLLIHGHTHRPQRHIHRVDGHSCERWVLNDWYQQGGYLQCDQNGCQMVRIPLLH